MTHGAIWMMLGKNLREWRELRHMTQGELADRIGVLRTSVSNIEAGRQRTTLDLLWKICDVLDCRIEEIIPSVAEWKEESK